MLIKPEIQKILNAIQKNNEKADIEFEINIIELNDADRQVLRDAFEKSRLKEIKINFFKAFANKGVLALIADWLKQNQTVTKVHFSNVNFVLEDEVKLIADWLKQNQTVTKVDLSGTRLSLEELRFFTDALKHNNTVTELNLQNCFLNDPQAEVIADMLLSNKSLIKIDLSFGTIKGAGAIKIAEALKSPGNTLEELKLDMHTLSSEAGKAFARAFKDQNCRIKYFSANMMDWDGSVALSKAGLDFKTHKVTRVPCNSYNPSHAPSNPRNYGNTNLGNRRNTGLDVLPGGDSNNSQKDYKLSSFFKDCTDFARINKAYMMLFTVTACAIIICVRKPEILTNFKDLFSKLFNSLSSYAIGK